MGQRKFQLQSLTRTHRPPSFRPGATLGGHGGKKGQQKKIFQCYVIQGVGTFIDTTDRLRNRDMKRAFPAWGSVLLMRLIRTNIAMQREAHSRN